MRSDDVVQLVVLQEPSSHVGTELAAHAALVGELPYIGYKKKII